MIIIYFIDKFHSQYTLYILCKFRINTEIILSTDGHNKQVLNVYKTEIKVD